MNSFVNFYIFIICSIWCKPLFIVVVVVVYKFCCTKSRSSPFFKSCQPNPYCCWSTVYSFTKRRNKPDFLGLIKIPILWKCLSRDFRKLLWIHYFYFDKHISPATQKWYSINFFLPLFLAKAKIYSQKISISVGQWSRKTRVQSQVESYQRLKKWYLMPPCLALSTIRCRSRVKQSWERSSAPPTPRCSSYWKGSLWVTLD